MKYLLKVTLYRGIVVSTESCNILSETDKYYIVSTRYHRGVVFLAKDMVTSPGSPITMHGNHYYVLCENSKESQKSDSLLRDSST